MLKLELTPEEGNDHTVKEPEQIFSLIMPDNVHLLPLVAETRLCYVNLEFGKVRVLGILDTGAQRSLLNASSYERVHVRLPPLMKPSDQAKRMVGASVILNGSGTCERYFWYGLFQGVPSKN